jgi:hypothetical protein
MPLLTLADLVSVTTPASALNLELSIAAALGLTTTAWQPLSPEMTIEGVNAQIVSSYSATVNQIAQGGFASTAAVIPGTDPNFTDVNGFNTSWMDLISINVFNVARRAATFATGSGAGGNPLVVNNTSATAYTYQVGQLHFQHPVTGATYTNTGAGTIAGSTTSPIDIQADAAFAGSKGTAAVGITLIMLTPLPGVSPTVLSQSIIGADAESNSALLVRDQAKLGSLSPNGAAQAYNFVATSIPIPALQATAPVPFNHYSVTSPITRVATTQTNGVVGVYVANAAGAPSGPDIAQVLAAIQAICVPLSVTATVSAVGQVALNLVYTVYIPTSSGLTAATVIANINTAIANYCSTVPIGGVTGSAGNIVPYDELIDVIMNANPGTRDLQLTNPSGNVSIPPTSVPVPGSTTGGTVVFVT